MSNIAKTALFSPGKGVSLSSKTVFPAGHSDGQGAASSLQAGQKAAQLRRMASGAETGKSGQQAQPRSVVSASLSYADSIREARTSRKKTSLAMKKLQYNFKKVSSEIARSKTPAAAKSAAGKARREVLRLKRLKGSEQYDPEEIDAAITHAKSMERIARKKAAHLQQEEMIHVTEDGGETLTLRDALAAEEGQQARSQEEAAREAEGAGQSAQTGQAAQEQAAAQAEYEQELAREEMQKMQEEMAQELSREMSELMTEISEEMQEMMEELDLMEELAGPVGEMSPEDFKMLQTKHRTDEMKEMAEADKEYLKVLFDKLQREKAGGAASSPAVGSAAVSMPVSALGATGPAPVPELSAGVPAGVAVDISL
ncbi:MAG: hypothetical protein K6E92_09310 [Lachnospiraceae bacterium]|nr:hypothetical protein [Lachnospiraceae bacterium]